MEALIINLNLLIMDLLDKIQEFTYENIGKLLFEIIPEYKTVFDSEPYKREAIIGNYAFMNGFATILATEINKNKSSEFVINSFKFINHISISNNLEVLNILKVGILEILYTSGVAIRKYTLEHLNDKNKILFSNYSQFYL